MQEKVKLIFHFFCLREKTFLYFFRREIENMEIKAKRTAREIKVDESLINNKGINVKVGTVENRDAPETIYIFISFWSKPVEKMSNKPQDELRELINSELEGIYEDELKEYLKDNEYFTSERDNIYIMNVPDNINYNNKRNFISIELYLHTLNIHSNKKIPLSSKKNTEIFDESIKIANMIGDSPMLSKQKSFEVYKKSMN